MNNSFLIGKLHTDHLNSQESEDLNKINKYMSIDNEELKENNYEEEPLILTQKQIKEKLLIFL